MGLDKSMNKNDILFQAVPMKIIVCMPFLNVTVKNWHETGRDNPKDY